MGEDHFSGIAVTDDLKRPTRDSDGAGHPSSLFGLAPGGVCHATSVTGRPVRSYRTLSPLPVPHREAGPSAVYSLLHFPSPYGARVLPGTLPCGARTFLRRSCMAKAVAPRRSSLTCSFEDTPRQKAGSQNRQGAHSTPRREESPRSAHRPRASLLLDHAYAPPSSPMPRSGSPRLESYCEPSYRLTIRMKIGVFGGRFPPPLPLLIRPGGSRSRW